MIDKDRILKTARSYTRRFEAKFSTLELNYAWQSSLLAFVMVFAGLFTIYKIVDGFPASVASPTSAQEVTASIESPEPRTSEPVLLASLSEEVSPSPYGAETDADNSPLAEIATPEETTSAAAPVSIASEAAPTNLGPVALSTELAESATETATLSPQESAQELLSGFYLNLNAGEVDSAYDQLSADFRESLSYQRFQQGYENVDSLTCEIKHTTPISEEKVRLDVELEVTEDGVVSTYWATCVVVKSAESWRLDGVAQIES